MLDTARPDAAAGGVVADEPYDLRDRSVVVLRIPAEASDAAAALSAGQVDTLLGTGRRVAPLVPSPGGVA